MTKETAMKILKELHDKSLYSERTALETIVPELKESEDERIRSKILELVSISGNGNDWEKINAWLEKQRTPNQVSIWKHWKDGIAGNGEGEPIYLIKVGYTYNLSSCLGFECDYIELSELDNLMLEKQGEKEPIPIDIDAMVSKYANNKEEGYEDFGKPINCMIRAYRKGIKDTLNIVEQKPVEMEKLVKGAYKTHALSFINYLDAHSYKGKMCVSNAECEDIEDAFANADWGKIGRYYNKFTQKPTDPCEEAKHTEYSTMLQMIWDKVCELEGKLDDIYAVLIKPYQVVNVPSQQVQCWFPDGTCMNPYRDCINCPRPYSNGNKSYTSTTTSIKPNEVMYDGSPINDQEKKD